MSKRGTFELVAAANPDVDLQDLNISVNTVGRKMQQFTVEASERITARQLAIPSAQYTLHWDGKNFKALTLWGK